MSFTFREKIPTTDEIKEMIPVPDEIKKVKAGIDSEVKSIFDGNSNKFLVIVGPCSADNEDAVLEYTSRLSKLSDEVREKIVILSRIYTNKPRTTGMGYKGMLHQPDPEKPADIAEGIRAIRKLHIKSLQETHIASADEMLYPENYSFLDDLLSYVAVGARSVENQQHRLTCSGVLCPVGMKNPTSGDNGIMFNAIMAAQGGHNFLYNGHSVTTNGNKYAHAILRGYVTHEGVHKPNYHYEDLVETADIYNKSGLENPAVIVDTNHSNSGKKYKEQIRIAKEILFHRRYNSDLNKIIRGLMIESYLEEGSQKIGENIYGKSITDPCLGWEDTRNLILDVAERL
jgi:3-deoxy-7-phosphoheptulonate synthase